MTSFLLQSPFASWSGPLSEVPDDAFAQNLLGDGLALDPFEGDVRAPCDGEIVSVAPTRHALTIRHECGAEVLLHLGVETVQLAGDGFECLVSAGHKVKAGDLLLRMDLDRVARGAKSLISPLVVLTEGCQLMDIVTGREVDAREILARVQCEASRVGAASQEPGSEAVVRTLTVPLASGLHARPAARIVAALKPFAAEVLITSGQRSANARSITAILKLDVTQDQTIEITATGLDARQAADALEALVLRGLSELEHPEPPGGSDRPLIPPQASPDGTSGPNTIAGIRAAPGGAIGVAVRLDCLDADVPEVGAGPDVERSALRDAVARLEERFRQAARFSDVVEAHQSIVADPEFRSKIDRHIDSGMSAAAAWRAATRAEASALKASGNSLLAERAADFLDVERQLIALLYGTRSSTMHFPPEAIVIAEEVLPSLFFNEDAKGLRGIVTSGGGATSHVAILAASIGVPMLVGCGDQLLEVADGTPLLIELDRPLVHLAPDRALVDRSSAELARHREALHLAFEAASRDCMTADGTRIEVFANCKDADSAAEAVRNGAEGCGLLRTEFLFMEQAAVPTVDQQIQEYERIASLLGNRPLIVRTLDAGSDKPLPFLPMQREENPALGMRGIRLSLASPDLLASQFEAIVRAIPASQRRIMLPMIVDLTEFRAARDVLREVEARLGVTEPTQLGVMVETPAAALQAEQLATEAAFLSIGSNDLAQYTLAADRLNAGVAGLADALHPSVLRLIQAAAAGAHKRERWLGLCGSIASQPEAAPLLVGLGVDELSASPRVVPSIKAVLRKTDMAQCRALADRALEQQDSAGVHRLIEEHRNAIAV